MLLQCGISGTKKMKEPVPACIWESDLKESQHNNRLSSIFICLCVTFIAIVFFHHFIRGNTFHAGIPSRSWPDSHLCNFNSILLSRSKSFHPYHICGQERINKTAYFIGYKELIRQAFFILLIKWGFSFMVGCFSKQGVKPGFDHAGVDKGCFWNSFHLILLPDLEFQIICSGFQTGNSPLILF